MPKPFPIFEEYDHMTCKCITLTNRRPTCRPQFRFSLYMAFMLIVTLCSSPFVLSSLETDLRLSVLKERIQPYHKYRVIISHKHYQNVTEPLK